jgi:hypothetical protein
MGGGKTWVELDRLLELRQRTIGTTRPHANEAQREMSVRIAAVESDRA